MLSRKNYTANKLNQIIWKRTKLARIIWKITHSATQYS